MAGPSGAASPHPLRRATRERTGLDIFLHFGRQTRSCQSWPALQGGQDTYLRALIERGVHVHYGRHQLEPRLAPRFVDRNTPASRQDQVAIWKLEEKETDVHIAISMYRLAAKQASLPASERIGQIVLVSADTDMTPALRAIREDHPEIQVGVVLPNREGIKRTPPGSLKNHSNWMRQVVTQEELAACQFPHQVPTRKKPARKPCYW
ncbi:hypothetical protein PF66_00930 [Pseudomonas asplenii]|uniref:Uncharacterized protein n=1 Tax=Pseudomonas asplenii TaxID=53407 RepID=A0A0N0E5A3_9PSED|nr:hypothetical protein PF66_00930 [Pseudomonas fuscovaginae]